MNRLTALKTINDDFEVEYEILTPVDVGALSDPKRCEVALALMSVDNQIKLCEDEVAKLDAEIDRLTNHADGLDYAVAVASGIITGLIDSFFVGETDFKSATESAEKEIADKVKAKALKEKQEETVKREIERAKEKGKTLSKEQIEKIKKGVEEKFYSDPNNVSESGQDPVLKRAIRYLEKKHPTPQDDLYKGTGSRPESHHLDDLAHHASLGGMVASIVLQFFRVATFVNNKGEWKLKFVKTDVKELAELWLPIVISGLLNWLVCIAEKVNETEGEDKIPEPIFKIAHFLASAPAVIKILKSVNDWCLHLYSDVAGSKDSKGRGAGIPGLFISLLKEISSVFPLNCTELPKLVENLYVVQKIDLRTEIGVLKELGRQAVPVIINEVLVRTFYFVRRFVGEYKEHKSFEAINWQNVIPFGNRTVERMMTIASGTFTAVDIADAAIRSGGFNAKCLLRVNFVGVGRFIIALGVDIGMGIKRGQLVNERMKVMGQELNLLNAKVFYTCAQLHYAEVDMLESQEKMWLAAEDAENTLNEAYEVATEAVIYIRESLKEICENFEKISSYRENIEKHNPGLIDDMKNILKWGKK